jgi:hypothetical protein
MNRMVKQSAQAIVVDDQTIPAESIFSFRLEYNTRGSNYGDFGLFFLGHIVWAFSLAIRGIH